MPGAVHTNKKLFESGARAFSKAWAQMVKVFFASFLFTKKKSLPSAQNHRTGHSMCMLV
jgi:hypothetical protein